MRAAASQFLSRYRVGFQRLKVIRAVIGCCTAALGGHIDTCTGCGKDWGLSYNSCRNRHCPKCQAQTRDRWLAARERELLQVPYFHVVFTLPHKLNTLIQANPVELYNLLFRSVADTLMEVAANPKRLGAQIGFLGHPPHLDPDAGVSPAHSLCGARRRSGSRPLPLEVGIGSILPARGVLRSVFRGKFIDGLKKLQAADRLGFPPQLQFLAEPKRFRAWIRGLHIHRWVVYSKAPFGGPEQARAGPEVSGPIHHRVAISNHLLIGFDGDQVQFRWTDRKAGNTPRIMVLEVDEFIRRFLLHVLPKHFVRIRHFGFMANAVRKVSIPLCRRLLNHVASFIDHSPPAAAPGRTCPDCGAPITVRERLTAADIAFRQPFPSCAAFNTS